ncbi:BH3 interacting domain death agonist isoform X2 [Centroberyx gerrardi]|uniref:BH3 interacting domain death agonist n=1 Tax=Centroberyx gerrardi TaxID=166262 RepID=UPI003AABFB56
MDYFGKMIGGPNADLVILSFLCQTDCGISEFQKELRSLGEELNFTRDINSNGPWRDSHEDGQLESDGHCPSSIIGSLGDIQPQVELDWPVNPGEAEALRQVAVELKEIADQLEHSVVAQATQNLSRSLSNSPMTWKQLLALEVEWAVRQGPYVGLEHLPQERIIVALTLTLVKGVCERAPRLLRDLFTAALQYISPAMAR